MWSAQNINVMPLRPMPSAADRARGKGSARLPPAKCAPWLDGSKAEDAWARRDPHYDDEFAHKGAVPTMGSSSGSLGASRRGVFPSGRGNSDLFEGLKLSRTTSMDALGHRKAFGVRLNATRSDLRARDLARVWIAAAAAKTSPRAANPEEARAKAVRELSRGVGIMHDAPPVWSSRPNTPSLAGIAI